MAGVGRAGGLGIVVGGPGTGAPVGGWAAVGFVGVFSLPWAGWRGERWTELAREMVLPRPFWRVGSGGVLASSGCWGGASSTDVR